MAIQYLFPIPDPILVTGATPEQLAATPPELLAQLPRKTFKDFILDLGSHQVFTRVKGQEQWDVVLLALDDQEARQKADPEGPSYLALPHTAIAILQTCINEPMFASRTDEGIMWLRGLPFSPIVVRAFRPFINLVLKPVQVKPVKKTLEVVPDVEPERTAAHG